MNEKITITQIVDQKAAARGDTDHTQETVRVPPLYIFYLVKKKPISSLETNKNFWLIIFIESFSPNFIENLNFFVLPFLVFDQKLLELMARVR